MVYPWAPNYCCKIAFVYKVWLYHFSLNVPCPGGVRHTAWLRADRTLCSARPILSFPAKDLSIKITAEAISAHLKTAMHTELRWHRDIFASIHVQICVYGHTLIRAVSRTSLRKCYFTWLCSGPRRSGTPQRGLWWCRFSYSWPEAGGRKLRFRDEERAETECKKTGEVTSEYRLHIQIKNDEKTQRLPWESTNCSEDSWHVKNYLSKTKKKITLFPLK